MTPTHEQGPLNLAGLLPSDAWPQSAIILASVAVFLVVVGAAASALYETRGGRSGPRALAILAAFWVVGIASGATAGFLQGETQRAAIAASETSFREVLEDRYAAATGASFQDVRDAARAGRTVVLVSGGQSVQVSPHVDGDLLTFFTADGHEYRHDQG